MPDRSPQGPVTVLASAADRAVYVYRNGHLIGRASLQVTDPGVPLGSRVFTMLEGVSERPSAFVHGRPGHRWMAVQTEGETSLNDLARRVRVPPEFVAKVYDILPPGATIVVTDDPALPSATSARVQPLMEANQNKAGRRPGSEKPSAQMSCALGSIRI